MYLCKFTATGCNLRHRKKTTFIKETQTNELRELQKFILIKCIFSGLILNVLNMCFSHLSVSFRALLTKGIRFSISSKSPWLSARAAATSALSSSWRLGCLANSYNVHRSVIEVCNTTRSSLKNLDNSHTVPHTLIFFFLLTVSTPPAISSVTLALMSSMDSLSSMSRLARTPGYFFGVFVSWCSFL